MAILDAAVSLLQMPAAEDGDYLFAKSRTDHPWPKMLALALARL